MPKLKQKAPIIVPLESSELDGSSYNFEALESESKIREYAARRKIESKMRLRAYAEVNDVKPIGAELKTEALAELIGSKVGKCPSTWLRGSDDNGHNFGKELHCGAEWCPVCGKKDSKAHLRRFARWLPKAQQLKALGLMVIEFPLASRDKPRSRKSLEYYGKLAVKVLTGAFEVAGKRKRGDILRRGEVAEIKAKHFSRGMRRWHYFGDVLKELKKLGMSDVFTAEAEVSALVPAVKSNCHLNMLLDAGYIPKPWLRHLVKTLRIAFNEPNLIVHYGYVSEPGAMVHLLKYTTRATFLDYKWDKWLVGQLYGFRNMHSWGVWSEPSVWALDELLGEAKTEVEGLDIEAINSLGKSLCYKCGLPIRWSKPRPIAELRGMGDKVDLGAGYFTLPDVAPPVAPLNENTAMRWRRYIAEAQRQLTKEAKLKDYYDALPDAVMPSLLPDMIASRHFKGGPLIASASNEDALLGGG